MSLDLQTNLSHNFLATILCLNAWSEHLDYSVKTTTSNFEWLEFGFTYPCHNIWKCLTESFGSLMVILPRSVFLVGDDDDSIELSSNGKILGIHLLYK